MRLAFLFLLGLAKTQAALLDVDRATAPVRTHAALRMTSVPQKGLILEARVLMTIGFPRCTGTAEISGQTCSDAATAVFARAARS
jgi:hypothetical protein